MLDIRDSLIEIKLLTVRNACRSEVPIVLVVEEWFL
jgi:hypothetical protein